MPPANPPGLQRITLQGIPVWKNAAGELFAWEPGTVSAPLKLGTEANGFVANWSELYEPRVQAYRASLAPRPRAAPTTKA